MTAALPPIIKPDVRISRIRLSQGVYCTKHSQVNESELFKVPIHRGAAGRTPCALDVTPQVAPQPHPHVAVDLSKGISTVTGSKIVRPSSEMSIELFNELRQWLEAAAPVDHSPQLLTLTRDRLC